MGLVDHCPRCGRTVRGENVSETALRQHLSECNDKEKIAKFARKKEKKAVQKQATLSAADKQEEMMLEKQWEYQGSQAGQLWMLSENSLRRQCEQRGLDTEGTNAEMIALLAPLLRVKEKGRYLMDTSSSGGGGGGGGGGGRVVGIGSVDAEDLPSNMHTMSVRQLRSVAAGYGVKVKSTDAKCDIIDALEKARFKDTAPMMLMNEDDVGKKKRGRGDALDDDDEGGNKKKKTTGGDSDSDYDMD